MSSQGPQRANVRGWTALRLLSVLPPEDAQAAGARLARDGRLAALLARAASVRDAPPAPPSLPHPSWLAESLRSLPAPVARLHLDRLGPEASRAVAPEFPALASPTALAAAPSPLLDALIGRLALPTFPPPPAWARPTGPADRIARAAASDAAASEPSRAPAEARIARAAETVPESSAAPLGLARIAFALLFRPDEAWGLAGAWPRPEGLALLAAWNAWPEETDVRATTAEMCESAARQVERRWSSWAA